MSRTPSDNDFEKTTSVDDDPTTAPEDRDADELGVPASETPVPVIPTLTMPQPVPASGDPLREIEESEE